MSDCMGGGARSCAARGAECRVVGLIKSTGVFEDKVRIVKM